MHTKEKVAEDLAVAHFQSVPGILRIFRLRAGDEQEQRDDEPIKLLEVSEMTVPTGIQPLYFTPDGPGGILFPSIVVEITPAEFNDIQEGRLALPDGWRLSTEYSFPGNPQGVRA